MRCHARRGDGDGGEHESNAIYSQHQILPQKVEFYSKKFFYRSYRLTESKSTHVAFWCCLDLNFTAQCLTAYRSKGFLERCCSSTAVSVRNRATDKAGS